ncbi:hypothetical protein IAT40_007868 [Kwoniella sp. CBS 6097]
MVFTLVVRLQSKPDKVEEVKAALSEASAIYINDKETLNWHVMQDTSDETKFIIVERYERPESTEIHFANPHYKIFGQKVGPLLTQPYEVTKLNEF